jgi:predicted dehydrogenase
MFFEAHRLSIFTPRALDVDVVLDLMIHDLDIVLTFANSPVREVRAVGLPILSPKVDIANVRVEFESGCVANFTASRVSTERVRKLRFFEPRQYVSIDYARKDLLVIRMDGGVPPEIAAAIAAGRVDPAVLAQLAAGAAQGPAPGLAFVKPTVTPGEPLRLEIESFLNSVRTRREPRVTAGQGRNALALALEIQASMAAHAQRAGLQDFFEPGA